MKYEPSQNEGRMSDKIITVAHAIALAMSLVWAGEYMEQGRTTMANIMWASAFFNLIGFFRHQITHLIISVRYYWLNRHAIMERHRQKTAQSKDNKNQNQHQNKE